MRRIALGLLAGILVAGVIAAPAAARRAGPTIVEAAIASTPGEFNTLVAAVVAADMVDTLNGNRQFTVFAPTDAAFAKLGLDASNVGTLPKDTLRSILKYHITPGRRDAASVVSSDAIKTLQGGRLDVTVNSSGAFVDDARIIATDIKVANGIIHGIDTVLMP